MNVYSISKAGTEHWFFDDVEDARSAAVLLAQRYPRHEILVCGCQVTLTRLAR